MCTPGRGPGCGSRASRETQARVVRGASRRLAMTSQRGSEHFSGKCARLCLLSPEDPVWLPRQQLRPLSKWGLRPQPPPPARLPRVSFRAGVPLPSAPSCGFPPSMSLQTSGTPCSPRPPLLALWRGGGLAASLWRGAGAGYGAGPGTSLPGGLVVVHQAESLGEKGQSRISSQKSPGPGLPGLGAPCPLEGQHHT